LSRLLTKVIDLQGCFQSRYIFLLPRLTTGLAKGVVWRTYEDVELNPQQLRHSGRKKTYRLQQKIVVKNLLLPHIYLRTTHRVPHVLTGRSPFHQQCERTGLNRSNNYIDEQHLNKTSGLSKSMPFVIKIIAF